MTLPAREVRIPMVLGNGSFARNQRLCVLRAADETAPPDTGADLEPALRLLQPHSLSKPGRQALAAVRAYAAIPAAWPWSVLATRGQQHTSFILSPANPKDIHGLGKDNASSAELGIALAALAHLSQADIGTVVATGQLGDAGDDTPVQEVAHIGPKLDVLWQQFQAENQINPWPRPIRVILPKTEGGSAIPTGKVGPVPMDDPLSPDNAAANDPVRLRDHLIAKLQAAGIEVKTVATLGEAARYLGIRRLARTSLQQKVRRVAALTLPLLCLAVGGTWSVTRPLDLTLVGTADVPADLMPARAAFSGDGSTPELLNRCFDMDGTPVVRVNERLLLRVAAVRDLLSQHLALVTIGSQTGVSVIAQQMVPGPATTGALSLQLPVSQEAARPDGKEELRMAVVAVRWPFSIDEEGLRQSILNSMQNAPPEQRLEAGMARLRAEMTGFLPLTTHRVRPANDRLCAGEGA